MNHRLVRNGTPLARRHNNLARMVRHYVHDSVLFGYIDQTLDSPRFGAAKTETAFLVDRFLAY